MKKIFMILAAAGVMAFSASIASAQDEQAAEAAPAVEAAEAAAEPAEMSAADLLKSSEEVPLHQALKTKFIEGGAGFMSLIIICLIIGLALAIERILYLTFSKINAKKLVEKVEKALEEGGIEAAKDVCRNTRGPVASIFYQGLLRYDQGIDVLRLRADERDGERPFMDFPLHRHRTVPRIPRYRHRYDQCIRCNPGCR